MKTKLFLLLSFSMFMLGLKAQNISFTNANLKSLLLQSSSSNNIAKDLSGNPVKIDTDNNGQISNTEAQNISELYISNVNITNVSSLQYFPNLTKLTISHLNLTAFDATTFSKLKYLDCSNNNITNLNIWSIPLLIETLIANNNIHLNDIRLNNLKKLSYLDISNNNDAHTVNFQQNTNLEYLDISGLSYYNLALNGIANTVLKTLKANGCSLSKLPLTSSPILENIYCSQNNLTIINTQSFPNLKILQCNNNQLSKVYFILNSKIIDLYLQNNNLTSLDLSTLPELINVAVFNNPLTNINSKNGSNETFLSIGGTASFASTNLNTICTDNSQISEVQTLLSNQGISNVTVNSSCPASDPIVYIPHPNFKYDLTHLSIYIKDLNGNNVNADTNGDGEIQYSEAANISRIEYVMNDYNQDGLVGINSFINLKYLSTQQKASYLDLQNLQYLEELQIGGIVTKVNVDNCANLKKIVHSTMSSLYYLSMNNTPSLEYVDLGWNMLTSLDISNRPNLKYLNVNNNNYLSNLNFSGCNNLEEFYAKSTSVGNFNFSGFSNLKKIDISKSNYSSNIANPQINLQGCTNLEILNCSEIPGLINLDISSSVNLKKLYCQSNKLTTLSINSYPQLTDVDCSYNELNLLNITNVPVLANLKFNDNKLTTLTLNNVPLLTKVEANNNLLTTLDLQNLPNVRYLDCSNNQISSLTVNNLTLLEFLNCAHNQIPTLNLTNNNSLGYLDCSYNQLTSLDASMLNIITSVSNYPLGLLDCSHNQLQTLNIAGVHSMNEINFSNNNLTSINLDNISALLGIKGSNNQLTSVDLSKYYHDGYTTYTELLDLSNNALTTLILKNDITEITPNTDLSGNPNLHYICCDDAEINDVQALITQYGYNCNINSYCNFTPGGNYNTITGTVRFDENNNGCDINDEVFEHMKVKIDDGITTGETFVKNDGKYNFYTPAGDFTITAEPENPSLYTVTPSSFTTNFTDNNNNVSTQNICVTKNGNVKDLEVIFAPVTDARPGFDAVYKVIWRNKGNTTLSGSVIVTFNNAKINFLSSTLPFVASGDHLTLNFTDLKPYANRASEITFTVNTPTHSTNPVNIGDTLSFSAGVTPLSGDTNPDDNQFLYNQIVVGSYDPNDITCLEGNTIPLSMVGKYLHYMINFENTGTAPATNVVVEMELNPDDFDIPSLQLQNTSHTSYTKVTGNKVEFMMKDINLAASAHGNIVLKIKSKSNLVSGDTVNNKANIYFDYNFPVETNEAVTNITGVTLSSSEINKSKNSVNVYPNPTKGDVNIDADSKIKSIEIYDTQGRIIKKQIGINAQNTKIPIHNIASGIYIFKIITEKESVMKKIIKN